MRSLSPLQNRDERPTNFFNFFPIDRDYSEKIEKISRSQIISFFCVFEQFLQRNLRKSCLFRKIALFCTICKKIIKEGCFENENHFILVVSGGFRYQ